MVFINADDSKQSGVLAIEAALANDPAAVISGGESNFVVMTLEEYQCLRAFELEAVLALTRKELAEGKFTVSSPEQHMERLKQ